LREIKFRAFIKWLNIILEVQAIDFNKKIVYCKNKKGNPNPCDFYKFDDVILMQCTEEKDKNGVEIYEGDIVADKKIDGSIYQKEEVKWGTYNVGCNDEYDFYVNGAYVENEYMYSSMIDGSCEVIGNIYENPELLK